jgi:hypothetical protein
MCIYILDKDTDWFEAIVSQNLLELTQGGQHCNIFLQPIGQWDEGMGNQSGVETSAWNAYSKWTRVDEVPNGFPRSRAKD